MRSVDATRSVTHAASLWRAESPCRPVVASRPKTRLADCWSSVRMAQVRFIAQMKTATIPSVRFEPDFRSEVEALLADGELLSEFVEAAGRAAVERRRVQAEFIARGWRSRDEARRTGEHVDADAVLEGLQRKLDAARSKMSNLLLAEQAIAALPAGIGTLKSSPFTCRSAGQSPFLRELMVALGRSGHDVLFEIEDASHVVVTALRHQLEDGYHCRSRVIHVRNASLYAGVIDSFALSSLPFAKKSSPLLRWRRRRGGGARADTATCPSPAGRRP